MTVPSATCDDVTPARPAGVLPLALAVALVVAIGALPAVRFAESPAPRGRPDPIAAAFVGAPLDADRPRWSAPIALPEGTARVAGVGSTILAITPEGTWPVWALAEGEWRKLRGVPRGPAITDQVGVARDDGFSVIGVLDGRSVIYDYRDDGAFEGARTVRDVEAGAVAAFGDGVVVFDVTRPVGRFVTETIHDLPPPGTVVAAVGGLGWLVVLTADGSVHGVIDPADPEWRRLGEGFVSLRVSTSVVAVGANATTGLHRLEPTGTLVRLDDAPFGPTVVAGTTVAVHDWSSESIWMSAADDRWERLPLWDVAGFDATFGELVAGADVPTVLGVDGTGNRALWRAAP